MKTKRLPRLFSLGVEIDTSPEYFGYLRESSDIVDSPSALGERMTEDGYIFLRGFWERDEVMETRLSIIRQLKDKGFIDLSAPFEQGKSIAGKEIGRAFGSPLDQKDPEQVDWIVGHLWVHPGDRQGPV